ncbi:MAG: AtpZ/AtpI family protein [Devosia sp.]
MVDPRDTKSSEPGARPQNVTEDLGERIARAKSHRPAAAAAEQMRQREMSGMSRGFRLASEFVAAIFVGAGLGLLVDYFLPTRPWGLLVLMLLGFAAGVLNVIRATADMNADTAVPPDTPALRDDEDD